jgi:hypothetical protein
MADNDFGLVLKKIPGRYFTMACKAKEETYQVHNRLIELFFFADCLCQEQTRVKYSVMKLEQVDYRQETFTIAQELESMHL